MNFLNSPFRLFYLPNSFFGRPKLKQREKETDLLVEQFESGVRDRMGLKQPWSTEIQMDHV